MFAAALPRFFTILPQPQLICTRTCGSLYLINHAHEAQVYLFGLDLLWRGASRPSEFEFVHPTLLNHVSTL